MESAQRKTRRVSVRIPASIKVSGKPNLEGEIFNISEGGAFVKSESRLAPGTQVMVTISFAEMKYLSGVVVELDGPLLELVPNEDPQPGTVKWDRRAEPAGFGIAFTKLSPDSKDFLSRLIQYFETLTLAGVSF